jgi:hypothetical protein
MLIRCLTMAARLSPTVAPSDWLRRSPRSLARRKERPALHRHRIRAQRRAQLGRDHRRDRAVGTQPTTTFTSVGTALSGANNRAARATPEYQSTAVPRRAYRLDGLGTTGPLPLQIQQSSAAWSCLASLAPPQEGGAFSWPTQATPEFQSPRRPEYATKARAIAKIVGVSQLSKCRAQTGAMAGRTDNAAVIASIFGICPSASHSRPMLPRQRANIEA